MEQGKYNTQKKTWQQLTEKDRYKIEALIRQGITPTEIGKALEPKRDRRTIERELAKGMTLQRNSDLTEKMIYLADVGQRVRDDRSANKGRGLKIGKDHELAGHLEKKIGEDGWSPDAVIGFIKNAKANLTPEQLAQRGLDFKVTLCTKTVYNMIDRGDFLNITNKDLPVKRHGKKRSYNKIRKMALNNTRGRSIEERPSAVSNRQEHGHWEMDCVSGKQGTTACLLVMTERTSRKELIFKLPSKTQANVINIINTLELQHKANFTNIFQSFTMDNGSEFLDMQSIEKSCINPNTNRTICYYAHPFSAYERGSNENANKLIRRFIPKGTNIANYTDEDIKRIEHWMNNYPRKILGYKTANQVAT